MKALERRVSKLEGSRDLHITIADVKLTSDEKQRYAADFRRANKLSPEAIVIVLDERDAAL